MIFNPKLYWCFAQVVRLMLLPTVLVVKIYEWLAQLVTKSSGPTTLTMHSGVGHVEKGQEIYINGESCIVVSVDSMTSFTVRNNIGVFGRLKFIFESIWNIIKSKMWG